MDVCPQCKINFDLIHHRCSSAAFVGVLQVQQAGLWKTIGKNNLTIDRLNDQIEALQEENAELRLKINGVDINSVKHMLVQGESILPKDVGLSDEEAIAYGRKAYQDRLKAER
ncbi:MAG: hypothetical protein QQN63_05550 [Nitrosopumilus sp.]